MSQTLPGRKLPAALGFVARAQAMQSRINAHARCHEGRDHDLRPRKNGLPPVQKAWTQINVPQMGVARVVQIMGAAAFLKNNTKLGQGD
jgi:aerobic-type carbon monoxide dehydrogenase small subunit (CoxS/CutS family)